MIFGNVNNAYFEQQAAMLPKPLGDALRYLKTADLAGHAAGRFPMDLNGVEMILQVMDLQTKPREAAKPEIHRKYIDVQFLVSGGPEKAACYSDDGSGAVSSDALATERDILFYENDPDAPECALLLTPGAYAIYLPWDVHVPGLSADGQAAPLRKVVMKVPMAACI